MAQPGGQIGVVAGGAGRAVHQQDVDDAGVVAAGRDGGKGWIRRRRSRGDAFAKAGPVEVVRGPALDAGNGLFGANTAVKPVW